MRSVFRKYIPLMLCLLMVFGLTGCAGPGQKKAWKESAEQHLAKLQKKVGDADHFTMVTKDPDAADKSLEVFFKVASEKYGEHFSIVVSRDASSCEDNYYSLYLKAEAEERANAALQKALQNSDVLDTVKADVGFLSFPSPLPSSLSLHGADTLDDLMAAAPDTVVLNIWIKYSGGRNLLEDEVDSVLCALQEDGVFCRVYPYQSDAVWFELLKDGCWRYKQTGKDNGAMMERDEYFPTVPAN